MNIRRIILIIAFILFIAVIGDDETRDFLKEKLCKK